MCSLSSRQNTSPQDSERYRGCFLVCPLGYQSASCQCYLMQNVISHCIPVITLKRVLCKKKKKVSIHVKNNI